MKKIIELIKLHKFYSLTMILSVAVTICFLISIYIFYVLMSTDVGPEVNRTRALRPAVLMAIKERDGEEVKEYTMYNETTAKEIFGNIEAVDFYNISSTNYTAVGSVFIAHDNSRITLRTKVEDENIWRLLSFEFLEGRPYTNEEVESESKVVVLTEFAAFRLFDRSTNVVGEMVYSDMNGEGYKVVGVVKNISALYEEAFSDLWFPFVYPTYKPRVDFISEDLFGWCRVNVVLKPGYSFADYEKQVRASIEEFNLSTLGGEDYKLSTSHYKEEMCYYPRAVIYGKGAWIVFIVVCIVLAIPVINGFGISTSYISSRLSEIAIRKVYGANDRSLIFQLILENFLITIVGAFVGLYAASYVAKIPLLMNNYNDTEIYGHLSYIPTDIFFNYKTIIVLFIFTALFNALSVYIPARRATKLPISITIKGD